MAITATGNPGLEESVIFPTFEIPLFSTHGMNDKQGRLVPTMSFIDKFFSSHSCVLLKFLKQKEAN